MAIHGHRVAAWDVASRSQLWSVGGHGMDGYYIISPREIDLEAKVVVCEGCCLLDAVTGECIREEGTRLDDVPIGITSDRSVIVGAPYDETPPANRTLTGRDAATLEVVERLVVPIVPPSHRVATTGTPVEPEKMLDAETAFGWHYLRQADGGDAMIAPAYNGNVYLVDVSPRHPWRFIQAIPRRVIAWSADWRRMAMLPDVHLYSTDWDEIEIFAANQAEGMKESLGKIKKPSDVGYIVDAAFSPDNRLLAIAPNGPTVHVFSVFS